MGRPKPIILAEITDKLNKTIQVLESDAIWAVFYKEKPFNLKSQDKMSESTEPKYKKVSFSNRGHAINLCMRLNKQFNCSDFSVYKLSAGIKIK
jgi:hypothetical protein